MKEIFKDITRYEGYYIISNFGNIIRIGGERNGKYYKKKTPKAIKPYLSNGKYYISLTIGMSREIFMLNRLVYNSFANKESLRNEIIHHIDGDVKNNKISNLELKPFLGYNTREKKY